MNKGTILYIGNFNLPNKNAAAHRVISNSEIFKKLGYKVALVGTNTKLKFTKTVNLKKEVFNEFDLWEVPYPSSSKEWMNYLTSITNFKEIIGKYKNVKAVIVYNYQAIATYKIKEYCKKNNILIIGDCTEWYGKNEGNIIFKAIKYLDTTLRMRILNKQMDGLIVVSMYLKEYYKNLNTVVIPTLIYNKKVLSNKTFKDGDTIKLFYAGVPFRLDKKLEDRSLAKDRLDRTILLLYRLYNRGVKFEFDIYGLTKEQYLEVLTEDTNMINALKDVICFHGRKSNEEVRTALIMSDFSILFRDNNRVSDAGFPTKVTESLNCSVPVITTNTSDLNLYLSPGKDSFFIDNKDETIAVEQLANILTLQIEKINFMKEYCNNVDVFSINNWVSEGEKILKVKKR